MGLCLEIKDHLVVLELNAHAEILIKAEIVEGRLRGSSPVVRSSRPFGALRRPTLVFDSQDKRLRMK